MGSKRTVTPNITYIFHVIGTLTPTHVRWALESLALQQPFRWKRFVLYNASDMPTDEILAAVRAAGAGKFETFDVCPVDYSVSVKSCSMDWLDITRRIDGADRYLVHKADFYLPPWTCTDFQKLPAKPKATGSGWWLLFNKFDMKSRATLDTIQRFANMPWREGIKDPDAGTYGKHLGKLAIPFEQTKATADGTMHGYTEDVRLMYRPGISELYMRWGVAAWFRYLAAHSSRALMLSRRFFACHMWHESPDRKDWNKNMSPEERF